MKENYTPPTLSFVYVESEQSIAAGSAELTPTDNQLLIQEKWTNDDAVDRSFDW